MDSSMDYTQVLAALTPSGGVVYVELLPATDSPDDTGPARGQERAREVLLDAAGRRRRPRVGGQRLRRHARPGRLRHRVVNEEGQPAT
ncbi:MAG: hypothetical protein ACRD0N_07165 [Acidimicrobiales bacterium]